MVAEGKSPIIGFLAGPTASGKSVLAVELARRHGLAVISADSMQVYRGMSVGTGVLGDGERRGVPHHLIGIADPREEFHAARFVKEATECAAAEWSEHGRRSLVAGGTGMWIQALREGLFAGPGRDESIRRRLRERLLHEGAAELHGELERVDPETAEKLSPNDSVRVIRALEVHQLTGKALSQWHREDAARRRDLTDLLPLVVLDPPREVLRERIARRVESMLASGWMEEARALHALDLPEHAPARKALGYRELFEVLEGRMEMRDVAEAITIATWQYARRQLSWFRGQRGAQFVTGADVEVTARMLGVG